MKKFLDTSMSIKMILLLCLVLLLLITFQSGIALGYHRAMFKTNRIAAFNKPFSDMNSPFAPFTKSIDDAGSHGTIGQIIAVRLPSFMIKASNDHAEEIVTIGSSTVFRFTRGQASTSDLKVGKQVVVIGEPGMNGELKATFIRILGVNE